MNLKKTKLGELISITRGKGLKGAFFAEEGDYKRITLGNFDLVYGGFKEDRSKSNIYYSEPVSDKFILKKGDIITPLTEQADGLIGSTAIIPESNKYILSQDIAKIDCDESKIDKDYCYYLLSTNLVRSQLIAGANKTSISHTSPAAINDCIVWIPELEEQKQIGTLLANIDQKISLNRQINDNLEAMARQLYEYWFVQFEFPDENGRPYKSSGGEMEYSHHLMRNTPMGWQIKKLDELADIKSGATPSTEVKANYEGDIVWVTPKDLSRQKSKFVYHSERCISKQGFESCSTSMVPVDSILVSSRAPIGLVSIAKKEVCTNQGFKTIVPKNSLDSLYLYYYVKYQINAIEQLGSGTTFREVSRQDLSAFPILVVGNEYVYKKWVDLQKAIANNQFLLTKETNDLYKLRNTLINLLMNGQVSVNYHL